jgi:hypothetical protein
MECHNETAWNRAFEEKQKNTHGTGPSLLLLFSWAIKRKEGR